MHFGGGVVKSIVMVAAAFYGGSAFVLFITPGIFGRFGREIWRDVALLTATVTASLAMLPLLEQVGSDTVRILRTDYLELKGPT